MCRYILLFILTIFSTTEANAAWFKASSENFVIYSDQSEKDVRNFATRLEKYHSALEVMSSKRLDNISPSNRVTIFVLKSPKAIQKLSGNSNVAGFYRSRAGSSVAFISRVKQKRGIEVGFSETVLLHEYAHHFQLSTQPIKLPSWYIEGYAEYFSAVAFEDDGSVWVGRLARHRFGELSRPELRVPLPILLDTTAYLAWKKKKKRFDSFYGQSWLLFHYLTSAAYSQDAERGNNMKGYLQSIFDGEADILAAEENFGDLKKLNNELFKYIRSRRFNAFKINSSFIEIAPMIIDELSEGAEAMMPFLQRSRRGVNRETALKILSDARKVAVKYPNDEFTAITMAEAEYDAGNDDEAIMFADRALSINPANMDAHVQKIYATYRMANQAETDGLETSKDMWDIAIKAISSANSFENDHPIPLIYYYRSFDSRGKKPSDNAKLGLEQALGIAPYDNNLRFSFVRQLIRDKRYKYAIATLKPLLNDPHSRGFGVVANKILEDIKQKVEEQTDDKEAVVTKEN